MAHLNDIRMCEFAAAQDYVALTPVDPEVGMTVRAASGAYATVRVAGAMSVAFDVLRTLAGPEGILMAARATAVERLNLAFQAGNQSATVSFWAPRSEDIVDAILDLAGEDALDAHALEFYRSARGAGEAAAAA